MTDVIDRGATERRGRVDGGSAGVHSWAPSMMKFATGHSTSGKRRPNDVIGSLRWRVKRAPKAVQTHGLWLVAVLEGTRGVDDAIRQLVISRLPADMSDELKARLAVVLMCAGNCLRDDLYDLFLIYLDAAIASERKLGPPEYRCVRCTGEPHRGARQVPGVGWLCNSHLDELERSNAI